MTGQGTSLRRYALTRVALIFPMVFILVTLVFLLMRVAPGDPISAALGGHAPPQVVANIKHQLGYDKPIYQQYFTYLGQLARGNLGTSITDSRAVTDIVRVNGAATLELTFFAMIVALVVGVVVGLAGGPLPGLHDGHGWPAVRDPDLRDARVLPRAHGAALLRLVSRMAPDLGSSEPDHPGDARRPTRISSSSTRSSTATGAPSATYFGISCFPAVTLGLVTAGVFIRLIRVNVMRTMKDDYIEAARARGIDERSVVYHHAFRNALVPVITIVGLTTALLLGGAVLTETTFNWPGMGRELVVYLGNRDYAAVQGIIIVFALVVVVVSVVIDLVNAFIDPTDPLLMTQIDVEAPVSAPSARRPPGNPPSVRTDRRGARLDACAPVDRRCAHALLRAPRAPRAGRLAVRVRPVRIEREALRRSWRRRLRSTRWGRPSSRRTSWHASSGERARSSRS